MSPQHQQIGRCYLLLSTFFGFLFGVRYTLEIWVIGVMDPSFGQKFLLVGTTFIGMLLGEVVGARISDFFSRSKAVKLSALFVALWAICVAVALLTGLVGLIFVGTALFGLSLGTYHSSLDAWFDAALQENYAVSASDTQLTNGFLFFNIGFAVAASVAFPLLFLFRINEEMVLTRDTLVFPYLPYLLVVGLVLYILIMPMVSENSQKSISGSRSNKPFWENPLADYLAVIKHGKYGLLAAVLIGSLLNLLAQYIDHFAPAEILPGSTVIGRSMNVFIMNVIVVVVIASLYLFFGWKNLTNRLEHHWRLRIIMTSVGAVLLLTFLITYIFHSESPWIAIMLGLIQAILLATLPLIKAWTLSYAVLELRATALSVVGVSKRLVAIGLTFVLYFVLPWQELPRDTGAATVHILIFLALAGFCAVLVGISWVIIVKRNTR